MPWSERLVWLLSPVGQQWLSDVQRWHAETGLPHFTPETLGMIIDLERGLT